MASTHGEVLERTRLFNVGERRLEILQLDVNLRLGLLGLDNLQEVDEINTSIQKSSTQKVKDDAETVCRTESREL